MTPLAVHFSADMSRQQPEKRLEQVQEQFIREWGRLSTSWGINRTMAQIHALLLVSPAPLSVDEIMASLQISRGNSSMNLRMLMDWGLVTRYRRTGERKDVYVSENDPWQILAKVVRERKRRELDPTASALKECLAELPRDGLTPAELVFQARLTGLLQIFALIDAVYDEIVGGDEALRTFAESLIQKRI